MVWSYSVEPNLKIGLTKRKSPFHPDLGKTKRRKHPAVRTDGFLFSREQVKSINKRMGQLEKQLDRFLWRKPKLGRYVYIARSAVVFGDVTIGDSSSVWYNVVLRGDINRIVIGHHTNIQDNAVLHIADDFPCLVGNYVTVGHCAIIHACEIGNEVLVGMGAVVLDGAVIGNQSLIGAKALVTQGMKVPPGSLVLGAPAKVIRKLTLKERRGLKYWATKYVANSAYCLKHCVNVGGPLPT